MIISFGRKISYTLVFYSPDIYCDWNNQNIFSNSFSPTISLVDIITFWIALLLVALKGLVAVSDFCS